MKNVSIFVLILTSFSLAACSSSDTGDDNKADLGGLFGAGKSDLGKSSKLIDSIPLNSEIVGEFAPTINAYGYVFEAKKGASLTISLELLDVPRDTLMALYGPYESKHKVGPLLVKTDDDGDDTSAPDIKYEVVEDGKYLIAFSSWEATKKNEKYQVSLGCKGTDFQCMSPNWDRPCEKGTQFIQGASISKNTTWDKCEIILLEPLTVEEGVTLSIKPGVHVKGNYLAQRSTDGLFGDVSLTVKGVLQAKGTEKNPVAFTSYKDDFGWAGIILQGKSNTIDFATLENARNGISLEQGSTGNISNITIQGIVETANPTSIRSHNGIISDVDAEFTFKRALIKGFSQGMNINNSPKVVVEDSIITKNHTGVLVSGLKASNITSCGAPAAPPVWRDPVFTHTDIIDNTNYGLHMSGNDLIVQVDYSNIINNGEYGIYIEANIVSPESFITNTNIYGNKTKGLFSFHKSNEINVSKNFWAEISDPELSQSWEYRCSGQFRTTGFSPVAIEEAGPREKNVIPDIYQQSYTQNNQHPKL